MARAAFFFFLFLFFSNHLICQVLAQDDKNKDNGDNKDGNGNNNGSDGNNNGNNSNNNGNNGNNNNNSNNGGNSNGNNGNNNINNNGNNNGNNGNNNNGNNNGNNGNNNNGGNSNGNNNNVNNNGNNNNNGGNSNGNNSNGNNNSGNNNNGDNNNNGNNNNGDNNNNGNNNNGNNNSNNGDNRSSNNNGGNSNNGNNNNNNNGGNNNNAKVDNFDYAHIKPVDIGVNWGNLASHPLPAKIIVQMLKDNGIKRVKLFDADENSVKELANTGIEVMVAIPNGMLFDMAVDYSNAQQWVKENVTRWVKDGSVKLKYVAVGNEPFLKSYNDSFVKDTYPALKNVQQALVQAGHGKMVKATVPLNADVYDGTLPSDGAFRKDVKQHIDNILKNLHDHDSPFVVNIYPFLSLYESPDFPVEFAFFEEGAKGLQDRNHRYTNVLDGNYDTLLWALKKAGYPDLKIIIGEIGWPTDGHRAATSQSAQKFYAGLFKKLAKRDGTPLRPGTEFDIYLFGFLDEDAKSIAPGKFERHWGIFRFDGQPKFPVDFTGRGQNRMPVGAKGVKYYDHKWCVLDKGATNFELVDKQLFKACQEGDCTATEPGSSCSRLDNLTKVSYAFNMYFQMNQQDKKACDFEGLALITDKNASVGDCLFPIQIDSGDAASLLNLATGAAAMAATVAGILLTILM